MLLNKELAAVVACLALLGVGCNKGPAREALAEVDRQLEAARPVIETYAPERLATLRALRKDAEDSLRSGAYTEALKLAQRLPAQIQSAAEAARTRREAMLGAWTPLSGRVPLVLEGAERRAAELSAGATLPRGLDAEALAAVQQELRELRAAWRQAAAQFEAGQVPRAVEAGREVQARVEAGAARLGLSPAAAMAVAAAPPPSPSPSPAARRVPPPAAPAGEPAQP